MSSEPSVSDHAVQKKLLYWMCLGMKTRTKGKQSVSLVGSVQEWKKRLHRFDKRQGRVQMEKTLTHVEHIIEEIRNEIKDL